MSEECSMNCSQCQEECGERKPNSTLLEKTHVLNSVKKVIGVVSGKGGVGKSLVTGLLAVAMNRAGYSTAVLDADLTGPSIPRMFGVHERPTGGEAGIFAPQSKGGIDIMSLNLLLDNDTDPVIWRGPILAGTVKQFWTNVIYGDVDYMFIDMPPGTGDVALTVFQSIPIDGVVIVTSPQALVGMIAQKAVNMARMMDIPVLGMVENMSYVACPDCGKQSSVFGESQIDAIAEKYGVSAVAKLPLDPKLAAMCDSGQIEQVEDGLLAPLMNALKEDFEHANSGNL